MKKVYEDTIDFEDFGKRMGTSSGFIKEIFKSGFCIESYEKEKDKSSSKYNSINFERRDYLFNAMFDWRFNH